MVWVLDLALAKDLDTILISGAVSLENPTKIFQIPTKQLLFSYDKLSCLSFFVSRFFF